MNGRIAKSMQAVTVCSAVVAAILLTSGPTHATTFCVSTAAEQSAAADCLQRPLLRRSRFRQQLSASVIAPRKLGVSCRVKVPVGEG